MAFPRRVRGETKPVTCRGSALLWMTTRPTGRYCNGDGGVVINRRRRAGTTRIYDRGAFRGIIGAPGRVRHGVFLVMSLPQRRPP
jgi:hypothetical protein